MTTTIRRATLDDADFVAWTILTAQRGHRPRGWFDIALGGPEPERLAFVRQIVTGPAMSWWHFLYFWIADVDGEPAAALCALPAGGTVAAARDALDTTMRAAEMAAIDQSAVMQRGAYAGACWMQGDVNDWLIEHVATRPAHRGHGLMPALLAHALSEGRAVGHARASIVFYIGNDAAEQCYAKAGFSFAEEKRDPDFEAITGAPGFRRFERAI